MDAIEPLAERARRSADGYHEFLRVPSLSVGVYVLAGGAIDGQSPHAEDEIYYVARGRARFAHGASDEAVAPGDILFVPAQEVHRFHSISEELVLLVVFALAGPRPG